MNHDVREAGPGDDGDIRALLRESPMPGDIRMALTREPSFFAGTAVEGSQVHVAVAEPVDGGPLAGLILRAEKQAYVNGQPMALGYLGGLRMKPIPDRLEVLRRGSAYLRSRHEAGDARLYLQTVTDGNAKVAALLSAGRLGLPRLRDAGRLHTFLLHPAAARRIPEGGKPAGYKVRKGRPEDLPRVAEFLRSGSRRQFFPAYRPEDFGPGGGLLRGLAAEDLLLAFRGAELAGMVGLWDQNGFKQNLITGYAPALARLRPLLNLWSRLRGRPTMPPAGQAIRHLKLAAVCIESDHPPLFALLLKWALYMANRADTTATAGGTGRGLPVAAMVHEQDPFLPLLSSLPSLSYSSRLYIAHYADGAALADSLDGRIPYVELGAL